MFLDCAASAADSWRTGTHPHTVEHVQRGRNPLASVHWAGFSRSWRVLPRGASLVKTGALPLLLILALLRSLLPGALRCTRLQLLCPLHRPLCRSARGPWTLGWEQTSWGCSCITAAPQTLGASGDFCHVKPDRSIDRKQMNKSTQLATPVFAACSPNLFRIQSVQSNSISCT